MHAISSYRGNRPTNTQPPHTNKQINPQTGPITIHCAAELSAQCKNMCLSWSCSCTPWSWSILGLAGLVLCCKTRSCYAGPHNDLEEEEEEEEFY